MAPRKTLLRLDRALPHPARENRSHRGSAHLVSSYGESQAKSRDIIQAAASGRRAVS